MTNEEYFDSVESEMNKLILKHEKRLLVDSDYNSFSRDYNLYREQIEMCYNAIAYKKDIEYKMNKFKELSNRKLVSIDSKKEDY